MSLRAAAIYCLATWAAIWALFLLIRFSSFDIRVIPGIGPVMLALLVVAVLAPIVAIGVAIAALVRQPKALLNWLTLSAAMAVSAGQAALFAITRWM